MPNKKSFFIAGWRPIASWTLLVIIIKYYIFDDYLVKLGIIDSATTLSTDIMVLLLSALIALAGIRQVDKYFKTDTHGFSKGDDYQSFDER